MGLESSTSFPRLTACYFILQASRGIQTIKNNISALITGSVIEMSLTFLSSPLYIIRTEQELSYFLLALLWRLLKI